MYITFKKEQSVSLFDTLNNSVKDYSETITVFNPTYTLPTHLEQTFAKMRLALKKIHPRVVEFLQQDLKNHYTTFQIPKRTNGFRRIDAPTQNLKALLNDIKTLFEKDLHILVHNNAFAYIKQKSCKKAIERHQKSKWFLKLDVKDFFASCNEEFINKTLQTIYPFSFLYQDPQIATILKDIVKVSLLNDGLPQGTPLSPLLTNILMIPYDYQITKSITYFNNQHFIYTRYADDLLISSYYKFNPKTIIDQIEDILKETPFKIKSEKTRFGSNSGQNWNLGLMLNKDNKITIGHKRKERLRAALHNFAKDYTTENIWSVPNTQILQGHISYLNNIEENAANELIKKYNDKFNINIKFLIKEILS